MKRLLIIFIFVLLFNSCSSEQTKETVKPEFIQEKQERFLKYTDKRSLPLIELVKNLETKVSSFRGEFTMKIQSGPGLSQKNNLKGEILFDKESKQVKIVIMDNFFGFVLSQVIANPKIIQVRSSLENKQFTQPMGDIRVKDNSTNKTITIPFHIIYYSILFDFDEEFKKENSFFSPNENRVQVKRGTDEYQYVFSETGLDILEYNSPNNNIKAVATATKKDPKGLHPPLKMSTRVTDISSQKDTGLVEIEYKKIIRKGKIPNSEFRFK